MKEETFTDRELEEEIIKSSVEATNVLQPDSLLEGSGGRSLKDGPGERGNWEAQWQDFLRTLQATHPGEEHSVVEETVASWEDPRAFLASFEQVAKACQWPRGEWAARLVPALNGLAEEAFKSLEATHQGDYGKVKAAILRAEALRMEKQRQHFRHFSCQELEDPRRLHSQLQELCHGWLRPERHSKEQILELLILEQFLASLPSELQGWIRAGGPGTCSQAVALAEDFLMSQQQNEKGKLERPPSDEILGILDTAEELLEEAQNGDTEIGSRIQCATQTSSLFPLEGQGTDQTRMNKGQRKLEETGLSLQVVKQGLTEPGRETLVWQVLKEEEEEEKKKEDPSDNEMGSQIKMLTSEWGGNQAEGLPRATAWISWKNGQKTLEEGCQSKENPGDQLLETEEERTTVLARGLSASVYQSSDAQTSDKRPLVSKYGRKYHYLHELNIADSTEDHVERQTSEENLQQSSFCDKQDRELTGNCELESFQKSLDGNKINHFEQKSHNFPEHRSRLSSAKSFKRNKGRDQGIYLGGKPYECSWCGKHFRKRDKLKRHQRTHTGERVYKCLECGKSFVQREHVKNHQRIHTGEKPYKCPECGKSFAQKGTLTRHQMSHTGEKPYKCPECGETFRHSSSVRRHQRIHVQEGPTLDLHVGNVWQGENVSTNVTEIVLTM